MPNLSPVGVRKLYLLYDNKICTGEEAAQCRGCLEARVNWAGYRIVTRWETSKRRKSMKNPLHYQLTEYDCGPTSLLNAVNYLFEREEIPPEIVRNIML